jgi:transcriptional regulator with XRE-family HTH domain
MDDQRLGRLVRLLRRRRGWRQVDLARRAGISQSVVSDLELGRATGMTIASLRKVVAVLGASVEVQVRGLGSEVDRLLDERHAGLVGLTAGLLRGDGWEVRPEVSYSEWGERGSIDLLAWHGPARALLVVEVKSELASVEATLRKHDEKVRLASVVAVRRFGWRPSLAGRLLVLPADRTARRRVVTHAAVLDEAYPGRTRVVRAWCRHPSGSLAGIIFLTDTAGGRGKSVLGRRQRVRAPGPDRS